MLHLILLVFSFVSFAFATFNTPSRLNLIALGLAFLVASMFFAGLPLPPALR